MGGEGEVPTVSQTVHTPGILSHLDKWWSQPSKNELLERRENLTKDKAFLSREERMGQDTGNKAFVKKDEQSCNRLPVTQMSLTQALIF